MVKVVGSRGGCCGQHRLCGGTAGREMEEGEIGAEIAADGVVGGSDDGKAGDSGSCGRTGHGEEARGQMSLSPLGTCLTGLLGAGCEKRGWGWRTSPSWSQAEIRAGRRSWAGDIHCDGKGSLYWKRLSAAQEDC